MIDKLRWPSPLTVGICTILLIVPFFWPITFYVWLRVLTGHRPSTRP